VSKNAALHRPEDVVWTDGNIIRDETVFGEEVITAPLDVSRATSSLAKRNTQSGVLSDWSREARPPSRMQGVYSVSSWGNKPRRVPVNSILFADTPTDIPLVVLDDRQSGRQVLARRALEAIVFLLVNELALQILTPDSILPPS
jgi:hypothetical protein